MYVCTCLFIYFVYTGHEGVCLSALVKVDEQLCEDVFSFLFFVSS